MIEQPSIAQLVEATARWAAGNDDAPAGSFGRRVARSALDTVSRELAQGPAAEARAVDRMRALLGQDGDFATLNRALADAIRAGRIAPGDAALLAHLKATARDMLAIDQPRYAHELGE